MISRYSRPVMTAVWSDEARFKLWLEIEALALEGMASAGMVPAAAAQAVRAVGSVSAERVLEIEASVKHDVIAFLTAVSEKAGEPARFMHRGMTSNDMLDTAFAVQLKQSGELILSGIDRVRAALKPLIERHRQTVCIGRTHGMHAEPISFGVKLAGWFAELGRAKARVQDAVRGVSVGKLSGAVGTYASLPPSVEKLVMDRLGLQPETVATQVVARDRHAAFFLSLAMLASSLERCCVEIRHLQRSEVGEVEEPFGSGQKGSSAMPHKKNPILSENLVGLARLLRSYGTASLENVALWHERDISHSSVERVIAPDACILADFMLHRFCGMVEGLVVHPERMRKNMELTNGVVFSGSLLIALADSGISREDAYRLVQRHALLAGEGGGSLLERVCSDTEITKQLPVAEIQKIFDVKRHLAHADFIINRALDA